jgi:hypothetical protein
VPRSGQHRQPQGRRPDDRTQPGDEPTWVGWQRPRGRRALRLLAAIATILGGLSLVLAMMELVIELGPRHADPPKRVVGRTLGVYSGRRTDHPRRIPLPHARDYGIAWKFRCSPGQSGDFALQDHANAGLTKPEVSVSGSHRHGVWWDQRARPPRSLYVVADCNWSARFVLPRKTGTIAPQPGFGATHKPKHQHNAHKKQPHKKYPHKPKKHPHRMRAH